MAAGEEVAEVEVEAGDFAEYKDFAELGELTDESVWGGEFLGELSMIEAGRFILEVSDRMYVAYAMLSVTVRCVGGSGSRLGRVRDPGSRLVLYSKIKVSGNIVKRILHFKE